MTAGGGWPAWLAILGVVGACRGAGSAVPHRDLDGPARLVVTERWRGGGRLIIVDETGDRLAPLLRPGSTASGDHATDEHPGFSPDGRWIVFASTRDRGDGRTSLWLAAARADATPVRLTTGTAADVDPTWAPDGDAIVFASDRAGDGAIDLHRLSLTPGPDQPRAAAPPERVTHGAGHELAPSLAGRRLVLQVVEPDGGRSWIAELQADGELIALTDGPSDGGPALAPDGATLAYSTARLRADGGRDLDVVVIDGDGRELPGLALVGSDEGAPAWSADGRWLFATSIVRDADGAPRLPSVVHVDTWARPARIRMLRDVAGAAPRLGPALAPGDLDQTALGRNPDHAIALAQALAELDEAAAAAAARDRRGRLHPAP